MTLRHYLNKTTKAHSSPGLTTSLPNYAALGRLPAETKEEIDELNRKLTDDKDVENLFVSIHGALQCFYYNISEISSRFLIIICSRRR